jgi:hypothetical protein
VEGRGLSSIASKIVSCVRKADELHREVAPGAAEGGPEASEREVLTGRSADNHVGVYNQGIVAEEGEVAEVGRLGAPLDLGQRLDRGGASPGLVPLDAGLLRVGHEPRPPGAVALSEDGGGEGVDLRVGQRFPTEGTPGRGW